MFYLISNLQAKLKSKLADKTKMRGRKVNNNIINNNNASSSPDLLSDISSSSSKLDVIRQSLKFIPALCDHVQHVANQIQIAINDGDTSDKVPFPSSPLLSLFILYFIFLLQDRIIIIIIIIMIMIMMIIIII